jgi:hypothetical protein
MTYYAALDVGLHKTAVCIVDEDGAVLAERMIASEVDDLIAFLQDFGEEISIVGLEAGTLTQWLTYGLRDAGFRTVVMEARHVKSALGAMRNKTDRNDARGIAQILRTGWYREVYVKSLESHYTRTLLASRKALLSKCVDLENEVRGLLKVFGIKLRAGLGHGPFDKAARQPITENEALAYQSTAPSTATTSTSTLVVAPFLAYDQAMRYLAAIRQDRRPWRYGPGCPVRRTGIASVSGRSGPPRSSIFGTGADHRRRRGRSVP